MMQEERRVGVHAVREVRQAAVKERVVAIQCRASDRDSRLEMSLLIGEPVQQREAVNHKARIVAPFHLLDLPDAAVGIIRHVIPNQLI